MYRIRLENTITHQIYEQEVVDANNGDKLYFRFGVNTADLADGEYLLTLYNAENNVLVEDILRIGDFNPDTLQYNKGENTYISMELNAVLSEKSVVINEINAKITTDSGVDGLTAVYVDAQPVYDMGVNDQKSRLEAIKITENGTYSREDGYNEIEVEVPDLNGSYDEGYSDGYNTGYGEGEQVSYQNGYNDGYNTAGSEIAETAQELNITENGIYLTKYSTPYIPENVTGYFEDGTPFYDYAMLTGIAYNTGIYVSENTEVEIWWKGDVTIGNKSILGSQKNLDAIFKIRTPDNAGGVIEAEIDRTQVKYTDAQNNKWYHFKMSYADGFWVDGVKIGDFSRNVTGSMYPIYINSIDVSSYWGINGYFGMIKIDGNIIIPTSGGFKNLTTGEMLEIADQNSNSNYQYFSESEVWGEGNLIKTVNVHITPSIKFMEYGMKCAYSTFKTLPSWIDLNGVSDCSYMFSDSKIEEAPYFDTSNTTNMQSMFSNCLSITEVPLYNTKNCMRFIGMFNNAQNLKTIPNFELGTNVDISQIVYGCKSLTSFPALDTKGVTSMQSMFYGCTSLTEIPALDASGLNISSYNSASLFGYNELKNITKAGGLLNLRRKIDDSYGWVKTPNLDYESCINILNGLYDFIGNGVTPSSNEGKLKVHQNFLNLVGDEILIGTSKGWTITT